MSPVTIAEKLNGRGVLPPSEYKRSIGIKYKTAFQTSSRSKWSPKAVIRILTNELYTGVLIQGRRTTPNYKVKKLSSRTRVSGAVSRTLMRRLSQPGSSN